MTQSELNEVLKQHKVWLDTKGEEGKRADLRGADLMYLNLEGVDLSYSYLRGVKLIGADLRDANLKGAYLRDANLGGARLEHAYLTGSNLRNSDLRNAGLGYADLSHVNLTDTGVYFFKGPKHDAIYNSKDDKLYIGCQVHNLEYWLENYVTIGNYYSYTDEEIEIYGNWIKSLKELL